jgi:glutamate N-acetyltransferase/amino-acid N-acetyltransferase
VSAGATTDTFFRSRWVDRPPGVAELNPGELPAGFRAAGVACGIKASGQLDVGLLVCDADGAASAARFTRNAVVAAPVAVSRRASLDRLRAVVVNSGNANVCNGEAGIAVAGAMTAAAAAGVGVPAERVGVASTGVIGLGLERAPVLEGIGSALELLSPQAHEFARAILTTDRWAKHATLRISLSGGEVILAAQAKGGGMIAPSFATMLCFVETDAQIDVHTLERLLNAAIERSFERISVDGQLSTNDSVFAFASGEAGVAVEPGSDDELRFAAALDALLKQLALEIVSDGEGATRVARLQVQGGAGATQPVARAIANSSLVKCALFGGDPNWGRIIQAAGQALPEADGSTFGIEIEGLQVARAGNAVALDERQEATLRESMGQGEVEIGVSLGASDESTELFFCDLGPEYVRINADYS